jgi:L-rhamnose mutarotase
MQAYGMALDLRDDPKLIARYRKEHERAWPEVLARLREIGVSEMRIFLLGRRMFMYCETRDGFDPAKDFARANDDPTYQKWDELMRTMQERVREAKPTEWWAKMELVFDLSWSRP